MHRTTDGTDPIPSDWLDVDPKEFAEVYAWGLTKPYPLALIEQAARLGLSH
jgi:hypothetical protein